MPDVAPLIPEITDSDIDWVCTLMGLGSLDERRRSFLKSATTIDVSACPGSGKTTLIVAKLAILAHKWPHSTKGICVLSHTNVAREEIQSRLGNTVVGQRLLGYPHFIDTIHGFVNRFLALPWLNSNDYPSPTIDNDVTTAYRRGKLCNSDYWKVQNFLQQKHSGFDKLRICKRDLSFDIGGRPFPAASTAPSFGIAKSAIEAAARDGYFCHDEMFVWARALLEDRPAVASWLRRRFPLVMLDEMQDTSKAQGAMLHAIFARTSPDIVVQRVGDPNQAIFDDFDADSDNSDPFPDSDAARNLNIPNSYRFGPGIAALASPFAVTPVGSTGLCGAGPKSIGGVSPTCRNTIFVFPDNSTDGVLDAYGRHVLATFDDATLARNHITAEGAVHQDASDISPGHQHFPKSVPHYWGGYTAEIARKESHPSSLIQYVRMARSIVHSERDLAPAVERVASGLIRLAARVGDAGKLRRKTRTHRAITDVLADNEAVLATYRRLIKAFVIDQQPLTQTIWDSKRDDILAVCRALCEGDIDGSGADAFLAWSTDTALTGATSGATNTASPNVYRVTDAGRHVDIRLGSIHSVKGQTHLATLILSTYWHKHSFERMRPWLLGECVNGTCAGKQDRTRLLQTYVAMTRPSHLVCLAVPRSVLGGQATATQRKTTLSCRGWQVVELP